MIADPDPRTALVVRPDASIWDDVRLQKLWLSLERKGWQSLAIIAASERLDTLYVAELLAQLAGRYTGQPSSVYDLRDLSVRLIDYQVGEMQAQVGSGRRLVIALRSIFENPTATLVARNADATVVCVGLGETALRRADETVKAIGRDRVIGCIVLRRSRKTADSRER